MPRTYTVECPSGLAVTFREFRVSDEDLLADPSSIRKGLAITRLFNAATESVDDPGIYKLREPRPKKGEEEPWLDWNDVLQGDRMVALIDARIFNWGTEFLYRHPCPNCRQQVTTEIDLEDLKRKPLPESSRAHVVDPGDADVMPAVQLPECGTLVKFRLLRGKDERGLQKIQKEKKREQSSSLLRFRVTEIQNVPQPRWGAWLRDLCTSDAAVLRAAFDEHDCGVQTEVDMECGTCDHAWSDDVRFREDFLFPRYRGKTGTTASKTS